MRLSDEEYNDLKQRAIKNNDTIASYIHNKLFPTNPNLLTIDRILEKIDELVSTNQLTPTRDFTISEIFDSKEYGQYFNVIPIGRTFYNMSIDPTTNVFKKVSAVPNTKPVRYKVK